MHGEKGARQVDPKGPHQVHQAVQQEGAVVSQAVPGGSHALATVRRTRFLPLDFRQPGVDRRRAQAHCRCHQPGYLVASEAANAADDVARQRQKQHRGDIVQHHAGAEEPAADRQRNDIPDQRVVRRAAQPAGKGLQRKERHEQRHRGLALHHERDQRHQHQAQPGDAAGAEQYPLLAMASARHEPGADQRGDQAGGAVDRGAQAQCGR